MNFLALLLGLALERVLTHLFHLREFRWLDPLFDAHLRRLRTAAAGAGSRWVALGLTGLMTALLVAPVAILSAVLQGELLQIPYFVFAVVLLLFSLGPRDLDDEVEDYGDALQSGDTLTQRSVAEELLERLPPDMPADRNRAVERAIYVQANNRIFGVVFWFLVLGPTGAWAFRVLDLLRHRAEVQASDAAPTPTMDAVRTLHGLMAWIPSRLLAVGYVLAFAEATTEVVARVGCAASGRGGLDSADAVEALDRIRAARSLVMRTLWMIWCPVIAVLTLYDWLT